MENYPVQVRFPVHWGEMDVLSHVNNVHYFRWFETARIELFRRIGLEAQPESPMGPILASTTCDFLKPVSWPADIVVGARVSRIGNTSFVNEYAVMLDDGSNTQMAEGRAVIVLIDYRSGDKVPIPDEMRAALTDLLDGK
jgi:acyl-CoA thioester hydrolase